jgi:hypothetical protein
MRSMLTRFSGWWVQRVFLQPPTFVLLLRAPRPRLPQIFLTVFTLEMLVKMGAMGLVQGKGTYLRDPVRVCVCVCVCVCVWAGLSPLGTLSVGGYVCT